MGRLNRRCTRSSLANARAVCWLTGRVTAGRPDRLAARPVRQEPPTRHSCPRRARGEAAVEFALLAPILLLVVFGIFELGRVVDAWVIVHNAAREGARVGARVYVSSPPTGFTPDTYAAQLAAQATADYLTSASAATRRDLGTTPDAAVAEATSQEVSVTATLQVEVYTPLLRSVLSPVLIPCSASSSSSMCLPVRAAATMRRQLS